MPIDIKKIEGLIIELNKSYKAIQFYPEGHPALDAATKRTIDYLLGIVKEEDRVSISISRAGFEYEGNPVLKDSREFQLFAKEFFVRAISKIIFIKDITINEMIAFLKLLYEDAKELRQSGGIDSAMLDHDIKNIWANEVNYEKLLERQRQREEKQEEPEEDDSSYHEFEASDFDDYIETSEDVEEQEDTFENAVESAVTEEDKEVLLDLEEVFISNKELFALLKELIKETDESNYTEKANKVVNACHHLNNNKEFQVVSKVAFFLFSLFENRPVTFSGQREFLISKIKEITAPESVTLVIDQMNSKPGKNKYVSFLLNIGDDLSIPGLFEFLINKGDINTRNNISDTLSAFGERALVRIKTWVDDSRWHIAATAVSAIGKIASEAGLDILISMMDHPDVRVAREVIRALGKVRSIESYELLKTVLKSKNNSLIRAAIESLGELKIEIAIPDLIKFTKKGIFIKNDIEVRKSAIAALGKTGSTLSIYPLSRIMKQSSFFGGKEDDDLRILSIRAIGVIGGEEAIQALEIGANSRKAIIRDECKGVLETVITRMKEEGNLGA